MESPSVLMIMTTKDIVDMDDDSLERLYGWVDEIPLTRPKKNMARDFSDGVLAAEVCKHYLPKQVEIHNYVGAHAVSKKVTNWQLLNRKVLSKLGLEVSGEVIRALTQCRPWAIESFLSILRDKIDLYLAAKRGGQFGGQFASEPHLPGGQWSSRSAFSDKTEADQHTYKNGGGYVPMEDFYPSGMVNVPRGTDPRKLQAINQQSQPKGRRKMPAQKVDMVPRTQLNQKEKEVEERQQTIQILQSKVDRLEHLLQLKDIRIEDLSGRVELLEGKLNNPAPTKKKAPVKTGGGSYGGRPR